MEINVKNSSFIKYLDIICKNIIDSINIKDYFKLNDEQKLTISYSVFSFLKTKTKININEIKNFILILRKKNEIEEDYELASVLNHILKNFDILDNMFEIKLNEIKKEKSKNNIK